MWSPRAVDVFTCPVCTKSVVTRAQRRGRVGVDYEWVCNNCDAHGVVHCRPIVPAELMEAS
ncbi:MAG: hypothetical protein LAO77_23150 [Acidobacteriia bacterium]|nr:hypothetical protein [Terriglobia bacterium]